MSLVDLAPYMLFGISLAIPGVSAAQYPPLTPLTEESTARIQTDLPLANAWTCSETALYSRAFGDDNAVSELLRIDLQGKVKPVFLPTHNGDDRFSITDFAVRNDGSFIALAFYRPGAHEPGTTSPVSSRLLNVNQSGSITSDITLHPSAALPESFRPQRIAFFPSGKLLVIGTHPSSTHLPAHLTSWFAAIFDSNGLFLRQVLINDSHLIGNFETSGSALSKQPPAERTDLIASLNIMLAKEDSLYIVANASMNTLPFVGYGGGLIVASTGSVQPFILQSPAAGELFAVASAPDALLGMWGSRDSADDEVWSYRTSVSSAMLRPVSRYKILGRPLCATRTELLVLRPDQQGGNFLVRYALQNPD